MKALTLTQPWATLVAYGFKRVETRSWQTPYRGRIAIHAAKSFPDLAQGLCLKEPFFSTLKQIPGLRIIWDKHLKQSDFPLGCVVATADLVSIVTTDQARYELDSPELDFGDYAAGRFAWYLSNVQRLESPIPARGELGLWEWMDH